MAQHPATTAIILCGGHGTRMGGVAKPLVELASKPLVAHVIDRLRPQVDAMLLSCAQGATGYAPFGLPVIEDEDDAQGPLGGFASALPRVQTPWVLTTPADTPFIPTDLVGALAPTCESQGAAVVTAGGHRQNLAMLLDDRHTQSLAAFYRGGGRAIHRWLVANSVAEVELPAAGFLNVNTRHDLDVVRALRRAGGA